MPDIPQTITLAALPAINQPFAGGLFAGLTTLPNGTHAAVALLPDQGTGLTWAAAQAWAAERQAVLPTRPQAALVFANLRQHLRKRAHWTSETHEDDASYAWCCYFCYGSTVTSPKSFEGCAVALRLIPLTA